MPEADLLPRPFPMSSAFGAGAEETRDEAAPANANFWLKPAGGGGAKSTSGDFFIIRLLLFIGAT